LVPGLKPWAEGYSPFGAKTFQALSQRHSTLVQPTLNPDNVPTN
jgi:hypothetical protein